MNHWLAQYGISLVSNVLLWIILGFNLWNSSRLQRRAKELLALRTQMLHNYIEALTSATANVCPFCAVAGGHGEATVTNESGDSDKIEADEEVEGWHQVRAPHRAKLPCAAAPLREACRKAFEDLMKGKAEVSKPHSVGPSC